MTVDVSVGASWTKKPLTVCGVRGDERMLYMIHQHTSNVLAGMFSVNGTVDTTLPLALTGTQGEGGIVEMLE